MQGLPHHYQVTARTAGDENVTLSSAGVEDISSAAPEEFGGPGDLWSPETLLVAAVADCFILTFRAVARASRLEWLSLECDVTGTLDRVDRVTRFTGLALTTKLKVPAGVTAEQAERLLHKAEAGCLITSSLSCDTTLACSVEVEG